MGYKKDIREKKQYLLVKITGKYSGTQETILAFEELIQEAKRINQNRILLDITQLEGQIPLLDSYELGEKAAKLWGYHNKVAIVYEKEKIKGMFENVAVNRGGNVRVLPDYEQAETWLAEPF